MIILKRFRKETNNCKKDARWVRRSQPSEMKMMSLTLMLSTTRYEKDEFEVVVVDPVLTLVVVATVAVVVVLCWTPVVDVVDFDVVVVGQVLEEQIVCSFISSVLISWWQVLNTSGLMIGPLPPSTHFNSVSEHPSSLTTVAITEPSLYASAS